MRKSDAKVDVIYVDDNGEAARTPDGVGFIYYDTEEEAVEDFLGDNPEIAYIDELREDWEQDDYDYMVEWEDDWRHELDLDAEFYDYGSDN